MAVREKVNGNACEPNPNQPPQWECVIVDIPLNDLCNSSGATESARSEGRSPRTERPPEGLYLDQDHLRVAIVPFDDRDSLKDFEKVVLETLDPPLNIDGRPATTVRSRLTKLRGAIWNPG